MEFTTNFYRLFLRKQEEHCGRIRTEPKRRQGALTETSDPVCTVFAPAPAGLHGFQQRRASAALDGFGLAAAGRSLLRNYDDVDRMLPDRDRLAAVQDRACRSNALRLIRCIGVPNGIAVKLQLFHSLSGKPRNVQGEQASLRLRELGSQRRDKPRRLRPWPPRLMAGMS